MVRRFFGGREVLLLGSGTQALAAAIADCHDRRGPVSDPEVILPAYGCPDLVSACVQAQVRPKLVDVADGIWGYDPQGLRDALSPRTVAIVTVNLMGLGDDAAALAFVAHNANTFLIQDSAQHLPREGGPWYGDAVVLSFGRGKPLNLLRGGALVVAPDRKLDATAFEMRSDRRERLLASRAAGVLFNVVTRPSLYWWLSRLPGMGLGETRYKSPGGAFCLPEGAWGQVGPALQGYSRKASYDAAVWNQAVAGWRDIGITPLTDSTGTAGAELLRLPLLAPDRAMRDRLVTTLDQKGLGSSAMYGVALNRVAGLATEVTSQGPFPNAEKLADRLFTLPTHAGVDRRAVESTDTWVRKV